jgi:aspartate kinase
MFDALAAAGVNIRMITTSEIKISVLVDRASAIPALRAVHKSFGLDETPIDFGSTFAPRKSPQAPVPKTDGNGVSTAQLPGMEDLVISGVELDEGQARITVLNVPDRPGYAAALFREIAAAEVFVDMIVQSASSSDNTHLSFTVPRAQAKLAAEAAGRAGTKGVLVEPEIAKLSVLGVGVRTHTGAATRMFGALAEQGINIGLINTSEVRINVATDFAQGRRGLSCLRKAFALPDDPPSSVIENES